MTTKNLWHTTTNWYVEEDQPFPNAIFIIQVPRTTKTGKQTLEDVKRLLDDNFENLAMERPNGTKRK